MIVCTMTARKISILSLWFLDGKLGGPDSVSELFGRLGVYGAATYMHRVRSTYYLTLH